MDKLFKSISLSHGFNGERSLSRKDENNDGHIAENELQNEQYSFNYSPILGITTKTKGRNAITFKINYNFQVANFLSIIFINSKIIFFCSH